MSKQSSLNTFDEASFTQEVLNSATPVIVEFGAAWCGPCRALEPILVKLAQDMLGRRKVGTVDIDACPNLSAQYRVRAAPTLLVFAGGKEVARHVGLASRDKLLAIFDRALSSPDAPSEKSFQG